VKIDGGFTMEKLIKSVENVHPGRYELRMKEMDAIYDAFHHDTFKLMAVVFKLGFARGQRAVKRG
jgi:hypothetical protein